MRRDLDRFKKTQYDLLVIGGGIHGASIAHLAAKRGLKVALIEKNDFASGTSGKSSKLMHGGLRYLENFQFSLVHEALKERSFHVKAAPHLVKPLRFLVPVYRGDRRPLWLFHSGVFLYDLLAGKHRIGRHRRHGRKEMLQLAPNLKEEGLKGGVSYFDAQMDDIRICLENVLSADAYGAHVANYVRVEKFIKEKGKVTGVYARDNHKKTEEVFEIRARHVFCAVGPWTNQFVKMDDSNAADRVRPTKGVHLVTEKKLTEHGLFIPAKRDRRIFFVLPWHGNTMIGTTDTDYFGTPDDLKVDQDDLEYLIEETNRVFPKEKLSLSDVRVSFAGLRPLVASGGNESKVSREHVIFKTNSDIYFVIGGKYTTYRIIAEDCVDTVYPKKNSRIDALYGSGCPDVNPELFVEEYDMDIDIVRNLFAKYGSKCRDVLELTKKEPTLKNQIIPEMSHIKAELAYAKDVEMALKPEDIILRRLSLGYSPRELRIFEAHLLSAIRPLFS